MTVKLSEKDVQILAQVGFKAAIDNTEGDLLDPEVASQFESKVVYLTETLINAVEVAVEKHATPATVVSKPSNVTPIRQQAAESDEAAAEGGFELKILGTQHGPIPAWALKKAESLGVTEVWDNRDQLAENPRRPWFRSSDKFVDDSGDRIPFFPPKPQGGRK